MTEFNPDIPNAFWATLRGRQILGDQAKQNRTASEPVPAPRIDEVEEVVPEIAPIPEQESVETD